MNRVVIESDGLVTKVFLDGVEQKYVNNIKFIHEPASTPHIMLDYDIVPSDKKTIEVSYMGEPPIVKEVD